jgi:hypothetical protein
MLTNNLLRLYLRIDIFKYRFALKGFFVNEQKGYKIQTEKVSKRPPQPPESVLEYFVWKQTFY